MHYARMTWSHDWLHSSAIRSVEISLNRRPIFMNWFHSELPKSPCKAPICYSSFYGWLSNNSLALSMNWIELSGKPRKCQTVLWCLDCGWWPESTLTVQTWILVSSQEYLMMLMFLSKLTTEYHRFAPCLSQVVDQIIFIIKFDSYTVSNIEQDLLFLGPWVDVGIDGLCKMYQHIFTHS